MSEILTTDFVAKTLGAKGYRVIAGSNRPLGGGAADSRRVRPGDLFAAFRGEQSDGNEFVPAAIAAGAAAVVCERAPAMVPGDVTVAVVSDTRTAMKELAHRWRETCSARVVGVTGTVGKTTAKEAIASTLATRFAVHRSPGNMNSREGLPLALITLRRDHDFAVLEMAMDSPGEIRELCDVARPDIGVVLNIGLTHISKLGSVEAIAREKLSLPRALPPSGAAILNADDPRVDAVAPELACRTIRFGSPSTGATLAFTNVQDCGLDGVRFDVSFEGSTPAPAWSPLAGMHTLPAALSAIAVAMVAGMSLEGAIAALKAAEVEGRMRRLPGADGSLLLDDRYNSSPASLAGALRTLSAVAAGRAGGRRIAVLGTMAELGSHEEEEHRAIGRLAATTCDVLFAVGPACRSLIDEARAAGLAEAHWYEDKTEAAAAARALLRPADVVLVKASRSQAFEDILPLLAGEVAG